MEEISDYLLARTEIEKLLATYGRGVDDINKMYPPSEWYMRDFTEWSNIFTEKVFIDYSDILGGQGGYLSREEIAATIKIVESSYLRSWHNLSSIIIDHFKPLATEVYASGNMEIFHSFMTPRLPNVTYSYFSSQQYTVAHEWTILAVYDFIVSKEEGAWKISSVKLNATGLRGDQYGYDLLLMSLDNCECNDPNKIIDENNNKKKNNKISFATRGLEVTDRDAATEAWNKAKPGLEKLGLI